MGYAAQGSRRFLIYEFLQGGSLTDRMTSLTYEQTLLVLDNIATAFSHAVSRTPPIFHGHLSTSAIMLDEHGSAKLSNLGLYRLIPLDLPEPSIDTEISSYQNLMKAINVTDWPENITHAFTNLRLNPPLSFRLIIIVLRRIAAMQPAEMALFGISWDTAGVDVVQKTLIDQETQTSALAVVSPKGKGCCLVC